MPLNPSTLKQKLDLFMGDKPVKYPSNGAELGQLWADAIDVYTQLLTPFVNPLIRQNARQVLATTISPLALPDPTGQAAIPIITTAFSTYALSLSLGMQPAFTATPPPSPLGPLLIGSIVPAGLAGGSAGAITTTISTTIDGWFRTGAAINNQTGVITPWL